AAQETAAFADQHEGKHARTTEQAAPRDHRPAIEVNEAGKKTGKTPGQGRAADQKQTQAVAPHPLPRRHAQLANRPPPPPPRPPLPRGEPSSSNIAQRSSRTVAATTMPQKTTSLRKCAPCSMRMMPSAIPRTRAAATPTLRRPAGSSRAGASRAKPIAGSPET